MANIHSLGPDAVFLNASGTITMENTLASTPVLDPSLTAIAVRDGVIVGLGSDDAITQMSPDAAHQVQRTEKGSKALLASIRKTANTTGH